MIMHKKELIRHSRHWVNVEHTFIVGFLTHVKQVIIQRSF